MANVVICNGDFSKTRLNNIRCDSDIEVLDLETYIELRMDSYMLAKNDSIVQQVHDLFLQTYMSYSQELGNHFWMYALSVYSLCFVGLMVKKNLR